MTDESTHFNSRLHLNLLIKLFVWLFFFSRKKRIRLMTIAFYLLFVTFYALFFLFFDTFDRRLMLRCTMEPCTRMSNIQRHDNLIKLARSLWFPIASLTLKILSRFTNSETQTTSNELDEIHESIQHLEYFTSPYTLWIKKNLLDSIL